MPRVPDRSAMARFSSLRLTKRSAFEIKSEGSRLSSPQVRSPFDTVDVRLVCFIAQSSKTEILCQLRLLVLQLRIFSGLSLRRFGPDLRSRATAKPLSAGVRI